MGWFVDPPSAVVSVLWVVCIYTIRSCGCGLWFVDVPSAVVSVLWVVCIHAIRSCVCAAVVCIHTISSCVCIVGDLYLCSGLSVHYLWLCLCCG